MNGEVEDNNNWIPNKFCFCPEYEPALPWFYCGLCGDAFWCSSKLVKPDHWKYHDMQHHKQLAVHICVNTKTDSTDLPIITVPRGSIENFPAL